MTSLLQASAKVVNPLSSESGTYETVNLALAFGYKSPKRFEVRPLRSARGRYRRSGGGRRPGNRRKMTSLPQASEKKYP